MLYVFGLLHFDKNNVFAGLMDPFAQLLLVQQVI
jgi:hypothetical protein